MLEQKILVNQELLDTSSKLLAEIYENLLETSDAKLQLIAEIQALEINLEDKNFEERNLRLEKLNELSEQNKSLTVDLVDLQAEIEKTSRQRTKLNESWKSSLIEATMIYSTDILIAHNKKCISMDNEIKYLRSINEVLEADLKLKNDRKRNKINCLCS